MKINSNDVTIQDIKRYEKLMNGKSIKAISNAHYVMNSNSSNNNITNTTISAVVVDERSLNQVYFTRHHWIVNKDNN